VILTFKVRHLRDFSVELAKARQVAELAVKIDSYNSRNFKHFGLKSVISCQVARKYVMNKRLKTIRNVNLTIPSQAIRYDKTKREIYIPCVELRLHYFFRNDFTKINQIEIDETFAYISVTIGEPKQIVPTSWIGIDRNVTGHVLVGSNPDIGKVWKFGKQALHVHHKYKCVRRRLQKAKKYRKVKQIKSRESNIVRDLNHKIAARIVRVALTNNAGLKFERLDGIASKWNRRQFTKAFRYNLGNWSFRQLEDFILYKSKLMGVPIAYVEPKNTSKECSRCGCIGTRQGKVFTCQHCGHVDHADVNAAFNIAKRQPLGGQSIGRLHTDRDVCKGYNDKPQEATVKCR